MKPLHKISILFVAFGIFLFSNTVSAQDPLEQKANDLVRAYQADLGLTIEQAMDFQKAIKNYLQKREEVKAMDVSAADKTSMLKDVSDMENRAMEGILNAKQLKAYKKLKKELQPV